MKKIAIFSLLFLIPFLTNASSDIFSFAWSENIGWISFNCSDEDVCGTSSYAVTVGRGGYIDPGSWAWTPNIGWITFDPAIAGTPPEGGYDYTASGKLARVEASDAIRLKGWARACGKQVGASEITCGAGSWDGWINFFPSGDYNYGVYIDPTTTPHALFGWAWGSDVIGWIAFNCTDTDCCDPPNGFGSPFYVKTYYPPLEIENLAATAPNYCDCASCPTISYSWNAYDPWESFGSTQAQTAYQVQTDNDNDFGSPSDDSGKVSSTSKSYAVPAGKLSYNTTYYWRLRVWNERDEVSEWFYPPSPEAEDPTASPGTSFSTPLHAYPTVSFDMYPLQPTVNEEVTFIDRSEVYSTPPSKLLSWTFENGDPSSSSDSSPVVKFTSDGDKEMSLQVTDGDGFSCTRTKVSHVNLPIPDWMEVPPVSFIPKAIGSFLSNLRQLFASL